MSERADVRSLQAFLALLDFELNALILGQSLEATALNLAEMGKEVGFAAILGDETKALAFVKPFHGACLSRHISSLYK